VAAAAAVTIHPWKRSRRKIRRRRRRRRRSELLKAAEKLGRGGGWDGNFSNYLFSAIAFSLMLPLPPRTIRKRRRKKKV
jgi:hypothetical protein